MSERFQDQGTHLSDFLGDIWVRCDQCSAPGHVLCDFPYYRSTPRFACSACAASWQGHNVHWGGPARGIAKQRCGRCGAWLEAHYHSKAGFHPGAITLSCPTCGHPSDVAVSWSGIRFSVPYDPFFGLPLQLQRPFARNILWAYNPQHLAFLRDYIAAPLRERVPNNNASLASRLPRWLKQASNREALLRAILKLEEAAA
jgi:hypothetical protein